MECIFCKIANGEIPCYKVYEDDNFLWFLDIRPMNPWHTLIIPKKHYRWVWDVENIGEYFQVVQKVANSIRKTMGTQRVVSAVFGEEVEHAHVWLVPRFHQDGHWGSLDLTNVKSLTKEELITIAQDLKNNL